MTQRYGSRTLARDSQLSQGTLVKDRPENTTTQHLSKGASSEPIPPRSGTRDYRLDFLRGLAVLVMVIDHVAGPSPLQLLTGGNRFFVLRTLIFDMGFF